jgi:hypothetical protein
MIMRFAFPRVKSPVPVATVGEPEQPIGFFTETGGVCSC